MFKCIICNTLVSDFVLIMTVSDVHRYDVVVIEAKESIAKKLQEGHGGWNPSMATVGVTFPCIAAVAVCLSLPYILEVSC